MPPFDGDDGERYCDFRKVFWTRDMIDALKVMTARGASLKARAKAIGVDYRTLRAYCAKHNIRKYVI